MYSNPCVSPSTERIPRRRRRFPLLWTVSILAAALALCALLWCLLMSQPPFTQVGHTPSFEPAQNVEDLTPQLEQLVQQAPEAKPLLERPADYPRELLELALRNREALDFVLGYPEKKDSLPADSVGSVTKGEFPLLMQWDSRWGYSSYGDGLIAFTGCGPTALSMVICGLTGDSSATPYAVAAYAQEAGYYVNGAGSSWDLMSVGCQHFGLTARELPLARSSIVSALEAGQPVICSVGPGDFTTSGHFILLTGMENGNFRVNDPNRNSTSRQLWDYDTLAPQIRNLWAFSLA